MNLQLLTGRQWKIVLKWALYGVLFLFSMLLQTCVLSRMPIGGIYLSAVPVCVACAALEEGAEAGSIYAMICGLFYSVSGVTMGPLYIFTLAVSAVLCGVLSERYCTKNFVSALLLSLIALFVCLVPAFLFQVYAGKVSGVYWSTVLIPELLLSLLNVPLFRLCTRGIAKIGR